MSLNHNVDYVNKQTAKFREEIKSLKNEKAILKEQVAALSLSLKMVRSDNKILAQQIRALKQLEATK